MAVQPYTVGYGDESERGVCLQDTVSGEFFGPMFRDLEEADAFIRWLPVDARKYPSSALSVKLVEFRLERP